MPRTILAYTLNPTPNNEQMGLISPLAEIVDNKLVELNGGNLSHNGSIYHFPLQRP